MPTQEILDEMTLEMEEVCEKFKNEIAKVRTGRATPGLLDSVRVDAYGAKTPINQVGTITVPESRLLQIQAWDTSLLGAIEKAILKSDLGLTPMNDGKVIRINIPALTEERRRELVRQIKKTAEEFRVRIRNVRRDANEALKKKKNAKEISEDDMFRAQEETQKATDRFIKEIDRMLAEKEKEVMEV